LCRNCLLKHVTEGKLGRRIEMMGSWGRGRKQLLDDLKKKIRYWKLKEEALDPTLWRTRCVRQHTEWMNEWINQMRTNSLRMTQVGRHMLRTKQKELGSFDLIYDCICVFVNMRVCKTLKCA
jgi:hypothetical protein